MVETLLTDLSGIGLLGLCLLAAALAFGETAIFLDLLVPGEVGMVIIGAAAVEGGAPIALVAGAAAFGALLGDTTSYVIGRHWGRTAIDHFELTRRRLGPVVRVAERHFERHGGRSVFLARWVGALRAIVPMVAGMGRLPLRVFLAWNAAASVLWATAMVVLGGRLGRSVAPVVDRLGSTVSVVVLTGLAVLWWRRRNASTASSASPRQRAVERLDEAGRGLLTHADHENGT